MSLGIDDVFDMLLEQSASDVVFVPGAPPVLWVAGRMARAGQEPLTPQAIEEIFLPVLGEEQRQRLQEIGDLDFSLGRPGVGRLRINIHRQRGSLSVATRFIQQEVPGFDQLNLPERVRQFANLPRGLVLVTGGAASGKSTTLAAMIEYMNATFAYHIITLEDPIEYTFRHGNSLIEQREIGVDSPSFVSALRHVVRQRPDVVLIGEMRDLETVSTALTAAETGHLVLATLHTNSAVQTVDRIIDIFPGDQQPQVRIQLASALQGVICQMLFHDHLSGRLTPAVEILVPTPGMRRAIRENETHLLPGMIEMGSNLGMQSMDAAISHLAASGQVTPEEAMASAHDPEKMRKLLVA